MPRSLLSLLTVLACLLILAGCCPTPPMSYLQAHQQIHKAYGYVIDEFVATHPASAVAARNLYAAEGMMIQKALQNDFTPTAIPTTLPSR